MFCAPKLAFCDDCVDIKCINPLPFLPPARIFTFLLCLFAAVVVSVVFLWALCFIRLDFVSQIVCDRFRCLFLLSSDDR